MNFIFFGIVIDIFSSLQTRHHRDSRRCSAEDEQESADQRQLPTTIGRTQAAREANYTGTPQRLSFKNMENEIVKNSRWHLAPTCFIRVTAEARDISEYSVW